jgi:signal transduction histidine kinase/ligand-binding sensor domain-containing protein
LYRTPAALAECEAPLDIRPHGQFVDQDLPDGPLSRIYSIFEDRDGTIWCSSKNGVYCYNGYRWTYFTDAADQGISEILDTFQDRGGHMWFATENGAHRYDGHTWTHFTTEDGLIHPKINSIHQDPNGHMWFATENGVSRYDGHAWTHFSTEDGLPHKTVSALGQDRDGHLWLATLGGACCYNGQTWTSFTTKDGLASNYLNSFFADRDGHLWFGSGTENWAGGGISRYDGHTWIAYTQANDDLPRDYVFCFIQDSKGRIWAGSIGGICYLDERGWHSITSDDGMPDGIVVSMWLDRQQRLWCGNWTGGLVYYEDQTWTIFSGTNPRLTGMLQDRNGHFWFSLPEHPFAVLRYDGQTWTGYSTSNALAGSGGWLSICEDHQGRIWVAELDGGTSCYDGTYWTYYAAEDGLASNNTISSMVDSRGHLWFGTGNNTTDFGHGVSRFDGETWTTYTIDDGLTSNRVKWILQDRDGHYWFATANGISRFDGENWTTFTSDDGLAGNWVEALIQDRDGHIWAATNDGISRYNGRHWTSLTTADGLPSNATTTVFQDRDGHYWFGTTGGLCRYDGQVIQTVTEHENPTYLTTWSIHQDDEGDLWFSTQDGICRYRPTSSKPPIVRLDAIVANRRYTDLNDLVLPSAVGLVAFEYGGHCADAPDDTLIYRCRLQGHQTDWQTTRQTRVEYHTLPPGTYTFEIQAVDRQLTYSIPATVDFILRDPQEERIEALEEAVRQRTHALEQANAALSSANNELFQLNNQLENSNRQLEAANHEVQQATQRKSAFLASMSHDLRTPMNAIIGYTRILKRRLQDQVDERQLQNLYNIEASSNNLLSLINEILDLSRIEAGRIEIKPADVDLKQLAQECAVAVEPLVKEGVELKQMLTEISTIHTDAELLRRVLMNLLSNAVKFTEVGNITLALRPIDAGVEVAVTDTGVGIPPEDLPHIFEEFRQVNREGAEAQGSGLGLAIVKKTVDLLGGAIQVESEISQGTTFTFSIGDYSTEQS